MGSWQMLMQGVGAGTRAELGMGAKHVCILAGVAEVAAAVWATAPGTHRSWCFACLTSQAMFNSV
jgi:hypothetical protein